MNIPYILLIHCKCNFSSVVEQLIVNNTSEEKICKHEPQSLFKAKETKNVPYASRDGTWMAKYI